MKNIFRIVIALGVLLSGVILVPAMGLPTAGFNWQRYAGVYNPETLEINHPSGSPGSYFSIQGMNFSPNAQVNIYANGVLLRVLQTDDDGELLFIIATAGADTGYYQIVVSYPIVGEQLSSEVEVSAATQIILDAREPQWPQEDEGTVLNLPAGIALQVRFMPVIIK